MDVPGVGREDLKLSAVGDQLTVRGERRRPDYLEGTRVIRSERSYGRFRRVVRLPADVDPQGIKASLDAGVLQVSLPRRGTDEGLTIEVEEK
jgi:HSP20 family protein